MQNFAVMALFDASSREKPFSDDAEYLSYLITAFELALYDFLESQEPLSEDSPYGSRRLLALSRLEARLGERTVELLRLPQTDNSHATCVRDAVTARVLRSKPLRFDAVCAKMGLDAFSIFCLIGAVDLFLESDNRPIAEAVSQTQSGEFTIESLARVYWKDAFSCVKSYPLMHRTVQRLLPLLRISHAESVGGATISADGALIDHLLGSDSVNDALCDVGEYLRADAPLATLYVHADAVQALVDAAGRPHPLAVLTGRTGSGKRFVVRHAAHALGLSGYLLDARRFFVPDAERRQALVWQLKREAKWDRIFCMLTHMDEISEEVEKSEVRAALSSLREDLGLLCLSSDREEYLYEQEDTFPLHLSLAVPNASQRYDLFCRFAADTPYAAAVPLHEFANKYRFTVGQIRQAVQNASAMSTRSEGVITTALLRQSCCGLVNNGLGSRATLLHTPFSLEDVILPATQKKQLLFACSQIRNQHIVYDQWEYSGQIAYGRGTSLLLYGPPGTGKTMTAGAIANFLGLELYRVDISKIVDKYIGETEKNIGEIFDRAKQCSVVLFFDEADALFSKRSEVGSSNDRHANMETGFLLQCVEDYDGISILATNYKQNMDPAFLRRIRFTVEFPAPQADMRRALWQKSFPAAAPLDAGVDFDFLAEQFELSGGNIKNIAVNAAFYAADRRSSIGMEAIVNCVYAELQKNHMITDSSCFAQYSPLLRLS